MKLIEWSKLAGAIGKLQGIATAIEWTEDVDPKKIKEGITEVSTELEEVFEAERNKLEDVNYKPKPETPEKKSKK